MKAAPWVNALIIGFLIGIIIYSILVSSLSLFTLIPLVFIYRMLNKKEKPDQDKT